MQMQNRKRLLQPEEIRYVTKYILEPHEESQMMIAGFPEDMRGAFEYEAEEWTNDDEPLFTIPEIRSLFE